MTTLKTQPMATNKHIEKYKELCEYLRKCRLESKLSLRDISAIAKANGYSIHKDRLRDWEVASRAIPYDNPSLQFYLKLVNVPAKTRKQIEVYAKRYKQFLAEKLKKKSHLNFY